MGKLREFYRDTWAEVNLNAIEENVQAIKKSLPDGVAYMAVVKANAYGHGAVDVARSALKAGASYLGVAILDEALALRQAGIEAPILVLGYVRPADAALAKKYNITLTVFQKDWVKDALPHLEEGNGKLNLHLKIDTGMGRIGFRTEDEGRELLGFLRHNSSLFEVEGAYTHFATADEKGRSYIDEQHRTFEQFLGWMKAELKTAPPCIHSGNSATALRYKEYSYNMVRVGISMYGLAPSEEVKEEIEVPLKEAFSLHSRVTHCKKLSEGDGVSYGATYRAEKEEWVATIPIGYADGWIRANANGGEVLVNGRRAPIIGRICMDQLMIAVHENVPVGTKVTLIGSQGAETVSADEVARRLGTINYEIPCMISYRVPRAIYKNGELIHLHNEVF
ncbi:alanine racemase [Alteribacter keqinensis]|uniref:Alanine racemase n=1 Tax=Alteribacter keqinensis TaxID=2483800 RepID=A0A3M7TLX5_9BACI|nr:alanine racemase [Alteribacter keqinensis]RNA66344.1 alanine racemase [Alteribacter keqinensis]